jgi:hypothetical protein
MQNINDNRKNDVKIEYGYLIKALEPFLSKYLDLYSTMKKF